MSVIETQARELVAKLKSEQAPAEWYAALEETLQEQKTLREAHADTIETARHNYTTEDTEIDDEPCLSVGEDGVWVSAWVWVAIEADEDDGTEPGEQP